MCSLEPATGTLTGTCNAVGPGRQESLRDVLAACLAAARDFGPEVSREVTCVWADEAFLRRKLAEVEEEARPLWFPEAQIPFAAVDSSRALAAGLRFRPSFETASDTLRWRNAQTEALQAGFSSAFENALLGAWEQAARDSR